MGNDINIPIIGGLYLAPCRYMICWSIPFSAVIATPFALLFSYYNTQDQKKFMKWNAKLFGRDLLLFWGVFSLYAALRTLIFDTYCDPTSVHYDKKLNAFERKKMAVETMRKALETEGKYTQNEVTEFKDDNVEIKNKENEVTDNKDE